MRANCAVVALLLAGLAVSGCVFSPTPTAAPTPGPESPNSTLGQVSPEPALDACVEGKPRTAAESNWYSGTCHGWRVGAEDVLGGDVYDRNLQVDCVPLLYGDGLETSGPPAVDHPTDLDIKLGDVPAGAIVEHIDKWACGSMGLSDHLVLRYDAANGGGTVDITRSLEGTPWLVVQAVPGSVHSCAVLGWPAVCIDRTVNADDPISTVAADYVFVIEDRTLDPHAIVLRLYSDELSLQELLQIATSVVGAS